MKPSVTYIISLPHATALIKKMHQKKHRNAGYHFELEDLGAEMYDKEMPKGIPIFAEYKWSTPVYVLKIFYEKPDDETLSNKNRVADRIPRK